MTLNATIREAPARPQIVGIGAGAGGLTALAAFLQNLPADSGMAFVIVTHLPVKRRSELLATLRGATHLPVREVTANSPIQTDQVYVAPPGRGLKLEDGVLRPVAPADEASEQNPIDTFLQSLAADQGEQAVAILLSGRGVDGVQGFQAVKDQGGLTLAQATADAEHPTLPRRVIATGIVDIVGSAAELAEKLIAVRGNFAEPVTRAARSNGLALETTSMVAFNDILTAIQTQVGHDFSHYKQSTLLRRIARRLQVNKLPQLTAYLDFLQSHPEEVIALVKDFLVSVTNYFRDADAFELLEKACIPQLFSDKKRSDLVRVWVAGCATGEEAYSVAMLLAEHANTLAEPPRIQVFATDVDEDAIAFARRGLYPKTIAQDLSPARLQRFFSEEDDGYRVKMEIRELVLFAFHNLIKDPPFSKLDLITCRNLLIYFNREAQEKVFDIFHYALNPNGYLFLGTSESADAAAALFTIRDKRCHLYQRREIVTTTPRRLPTTTLFSMESRPLAPARLNEPRPRTVEEMYQAWTLRRYGPPRVLVDENYEVAYIFGGADRYLRERDGAVTQNILLKVLPGLRLDLRAALYQALHKGERSESRLLQVEIDGETRLLQLHVGPVDEPGFPKNYLEVVFVEQKASTLASSDASPDVHTAVDSALVGRLEEELMRTRERLQTIIEEHEIANEELKASNEELQSINEELKSTTEELETSKEELQSMNEELITVNQDLKFKIDELSRANNDLFNLIASTNVGTIFVDSGLRIKRFTPRASELFYLIEADIGRPFTHLTHQLRHNRLAELAVRVLETHEELEEIVQAAAESGTSRQGSALPPNTEVAQRRKDDRWYIMRMFPYRTVNQEIDGVVITFVDISDLRRAEHELQQRIQQQAVADLGRQALQGHDEGTLLETAATRVAEILDAEICGIFVLQADGETLRLEAGVGWQDAVIGQATVRALPELHLGYALAADEPIIVENINREARFRFSPLLAGHALVSSVSVAMRDHEHRYGVLGVYSRSIRTFSGSDVTFLQAVANVLAAALARSDYEEALQESEQRFRTMADTAPVLIWTSGADALRDFFNQPWLDFTGRAIAQELGNGWAEVLHPDDYDRCLLVYITAFGARQDFEIEYRLRRHDGIYRWVLDRGTPRFTPEGDFAGYIGSCIDITERRQALEALQASEERFATAFHSSPNLMTISTLNDGRYIEVSAAVLRNTGYTVDEMVGHTAHELNIWANPVDRERLVELLKTQGFVRDFETGLRSKNGEVRRVLLSADSIELNGEPCLLTASLDITERKQAEAILDRYQLLAERTRDIILFVRRDGQIVEANEAATAAYGYDHAALLEMNIYDLRAAETTPFVAEQMQTADDGGILFETLHRRRDGSTFLVEVSSIGADIGEERLLLSIIRDITERKRAEADLRASEERFRTLANSAPVLIWVNGADGGCEFVNQAYLDFFGKRLEEVQGFGWQPSLHPDDVEAYVNAYLSAFRERKPFRAQARILHVSGEYRWLDAYGLPHFSPQREFLGYVGSCSDIHEIKRAEQALRASEERYRALFEHASDAIFIASDDRTYVDANQAACALSGYTREELIGKSVNDLTPPEALPRLDEDRQRLLAPPQRRLVQVNEWELLRKDGHRVPIEVSARRLPDGRWQAFIRDITERRRAERNQQFLNELNEQTRLLADPEEIEQIVVQRLGEYLGVDRCIIKAIDLGGGSATITHAWGQASESLAGNTYPLSAFGSPDYILDALEGHTLAVENTATDPRTTASQDPLLAQNLQAIIRVPCFYQGEWVASLHVAQFTPRVWRADEVWLVETVTRQFWPLIEKARVEQKLHASRHFLARIAQAIPDNLMVYDLPSQRIIYHNPGLLKVLGLSDEPSPALLQVDIDERVHPDDLVYVQEEFARVHTAADDEVVEITFRYQFPNGEYRWLQERTVVFARDLAGAVTQHLSTSSDITERKEAERDLRFIAELAERIRLADDAETLIQEVAQAVGEHVQVGRCLFIEVNVAADRGIIRGQYCRSLPAVASEYKLSDYSSEIGRELAAGHAIINDDAQHDPRTAALYETIYAPARERAYVGVPLLREGQWQGILSVTTDQPRQWQPREITLLETVAERTWLAVEKLQLAAELRASEEQLRVITDAVPGLIAYADAEQRYRFVNATYERWFGLANEQIVGKRVVDLLDEAAYRRARPYIEAALAGQAVTFENDTIYRHGSRSVLATYVPHLGQEGEVLGFYVLVTDISEGKAAEAALRASEERLRLAAETGGVGIFDFDLIQRRGEFSPIYRAITQFSPEGELTMQTWLERVYPDDRTLVEQTLRRVMEIGDAYKYEYRILWPDGAIRWVEVSGTGVKNDQGRPIRITGAMRDITERKTAEERLRFMTEASAVLSSSLDYQATLQRVADLMVPRLADWCTVDMLRPDGTIDLVAVAHVNPDKAAWGRELRRRFPPDMNAPQGLPHVLRTGQAEFYPVIPFEQLLAAAQDEEQRQILDQLPIKSVIIVPLRAREQVIGAIQLVWSDSNRYYSEADLRFAEELAHRASLAVDNARLYQEARTAEAQLRELNTELEKRVQERTAELERSNQELNQFAYVASHDLKAPLRAIQHLAGWIDEDDGKVLSVTSQEHLARLRGRIRRMERLLDDLLAYSRAGRVHYAAEPVDTTAMVHDIVETLAPPPGFTITLAEPLPTLLTERTPLELVLRNLTANAIKHHDRPDGRIDISACEGNDYVEFRIRDDGPGIAEQFHARIFEMFQTLQPRDQLESSGMGLALVKKIVETYGGRVWVVSQEGRGATFAFTWPKRAE